MRAVPELPWTELSIRPSVCTPWSPALALGVLPPLPNSQRASAFFCSLIYLWGILANWTWLLVYLVSPPSSGFRPPPLLPCPGWWYGQRTAKGGHSSLRSPTWLQAMSSGNEPGIENISHGLRIAGTRAAGAEPTWGLGPYFLVCERGCCFSTSVCLLLPLPLYVSRACGHTWCDQLPPLLRPPGQRPTAAVRGGRRPLPPAPLLPCFCPVGRTKRTKPNGLPSPSPNPVRPGCWR